MRPILFRRHKIYFARQIFFTPRKKQKRTAPASHGSSVGEYERWLRGARGASGGARAR